MVNLGSSRLTIFMSFLCVSHQFINIKIETNHVAHCTADLDHSTSTKPLCGCNDSQDLSGHLMYILSSVSRTLYVLICELII